MTGHEGSATVRELVAHLALALSRHLRESRRDGIAVPAQLVGLTELLHNVYATLPANPRQSAPLIDDPSADSHDAVMEPPLLTKREAGRALRCSVRTVERLLASGALVGVRVGGTTRVRREDLASYIASLGPASSFRDQVERKASA